MLGVGDKAPPLSGTSYDGRIVSIGIPGKRTVLYFYPKASTGG